MNSEHPATPWVEVELNPLSASEKAIGYGNAMKQPQTWSPSSYSDKPVLVLVHVLMCVPGYYVLALVVRCTSQYYRY